ncbi:hypothetical protein F4604DRAFT_1159052 [Suillus subluteus]|nr:hypothetical protein F4604DRAFT_1159052 [Suillus subluteus]
MQFSQSFSCTAFSLESPTGHIMLFSPALVLNVRPEFFSFLKFVSILANSQSGLQSLISLLRTVGYSNFNDQVDKRESPMPSSSSVAGGMLKSLLVRRQSSHVSRMASQASMDTVIGVMASFPLGTHEAIYGDTNQDARNEVASRSN